MTEIAGFFLALALPVLIIRGIVAIPPWFMITCGIGGISVALAFQIHDSTAWSWIIAAPLGGAIGAAILGVAIKLVNMDLNND